MGGKSGKRGRRGRKGRGRYDEGYFRVVAAVADDGVVVFVLKAAQGFHYHNSALKELIEAAVLAVEARHGAADIDEEDEALGLLLKAA